MHYLLHAHKQSLAYSIYVYNMPGARGLFVLRNHQYALNFNLKG